MERITTKSHSQSKANVKGVGRRIRAIRLARQMTQQELAFQIGVTPDQIPQWELERRDPQIRNIVKLCVVLGVSADFLLLGKTRE